MQAVLSASASVLLSPRHPAQPRPRFQLLHLHAAILPRGSAPMQTASASEYACWRIKQVRPVWCCLCTCGIAHAVHLERLQPAPAAQCNACE